MKMDITTQLSGSCQVEDVVKIENSSYYQCHFDYDVR